MKTITYAKPARKALRRIPANEAQRIIAKIEQYARNPQSLGNNVKALVGSEFIRLRVGDWRVIMDDQGEVLEVLQVGARGGIYE